jgi:hypothetical protein
MKILIDTHILVRAEVNRIIDRHLRDVIRHTTELKYWLMVHPRSILEVEKDKNIPDPDRDVLLSKIGRYPTLDSQSNPSDDRDFMAAIQKPKDGRENIDNRLLYCLYKKEVDLFLTEDVEIIKKAALLNISNKVIALKEASSYFKKILMKKKIKVGEAPTFCFYKRGSKWHIGEKDKENVFDDLRGFGFIHYLLKHENQNLEPVTVYHGDTSTINKSPQDGFSKEDKEQHQFHPEKPIYAGSPNANERRVMTNKIQQLQEGIDLLQEPFDDSWSPEDAMVAKEKVRERIDKDMKEIKALEAALYHRPPRDFNSSTEKARVNVTRSIKNALKKIKNDASSPAITRYLSESTIKTGDSCCYKPVLSDIPTWILTPESDNQ